MRRNIAILTTLAAKIPDVPVPQIVVIFTMIGIRAAPFIGVILFMISQRREEQRRKDDWFKQKKRKKKKKHKWATGEAKPSEDGD